MEQHPIMQHLWSFLVDIPFDINVHLSLRNTLILTLMEDLELNIADEVPTPVQRLMQLISELNMEQQKLHDWADAVDLAVGQIVSLMNHR